MLVQTYQCNPFENIVFNKAITINKIEKITMSGQKRIND